MSSARACPCSSRSARVVVATASQAVAATEHTAMSTDAISSRTSRRLRSGIRARRVWEGPPSAAAAWAPDGSRRRFMHGRR
ncbi:hypothetical protein ABT136_29250 [Streptomyces sp. NPDC001856]|uniref:hypothetical protein n=1 Tax=Streptomyces sp. NPDC001856 TaxID=3154399 RepID=UPI00332C38BE